ncbi:MAG: deoxyribonuclease IV [Patescibacteria group bacterium]|jgi:deoxyribonuclease-4
MNIGAHVSIAGGVYNAPINAHRAGCECFQMFTRSPQGGSAPILDPGTVSSFHANMKQYKQAAVYIHTPYYINLASATDRIRLNSIRIIREELERGTLLGAKALMTHLGSSAGVGQDLAVEKVIEGIKKIVEGYKGTTRFLLEIAAGSGNIIGDTFEEIGQIIKAVPEYDLGVCFDTCHAFASGYDLRTKKAIGVTLKAFEKAIGLDRLVLIHANDAKFEIGTHKDRHEHIGYGHIGREGFRILLHHPQLRAVDFILETPPSEKKEINDIMMLKKLRT